MYRRLAQEAVATTSGLEQHRAGSRAWHRIRGRAMQTVLVTLLLGLLSGAGSQLVMPPGLFDKAIQAFEASSADLIRYDLAAGARLPVHAPGFVGLEQAVGRAWSAAGLDGLTPQVTAGQEAGSLYLTWAAEEGTEGWRVVALREEGAASAFVWLRASGASPRRLRQEVGQVLEAARRLSPMPQGYLYVRLEGRYREPMGPAAREAVALSLAQVAGEDQALTVEVAAAPEGALLVVETTGPSRAELPLPTYSQAR